MSPQAASALLAAAAVLAAILFLLPVIVALVRDVEGKLDIVLLALFLGWTGFAWACAIYLAASRTRRSRGDGTRAAAPPGPIRSALSRPDAYCEGVYLVSAGTDSHTWAVHSGGGWRIVYEVDGVERLVGEVAETDVPLSVLADALQPAVD
jgi:hypothetical protein